MCHYFTDWSHFPEWQLENFSGIFQLDKPKFLLILFATFKEGSAGTMAKTRKEKNSVDSFRKREPLLLSPDDCKPILYRAEEIIQDTCTECGYDIQNIRPTNWMYILYQIAETIFKPHPELIREFSPYSNEYTGNYLLDNIETIYDCVYVPLCDKYSQIVSGYSLFAMIGRKDLYCMPHEWENRGKVTSKNTNLRQKWIHDREISLQNAMLSSNQNPVKYLAIGNHEFAWNESKPEKIEQRKPVLSLSDVPELVENKLSDDLLLPDFDDSE